MRTGVAADPLLPGPAAAAAADAFGVTRSRIRAARRSWKEQNKGWASWSRTASILDG